jgi:hypothetical protein
VTASRVLPELFLRAEVRKYPSKRSIVYKAVLCHRLRDQRRSNQIKGNFKICRITGKYDELTNEINQQKGQFKG